MEHERREEKLREEQIREQKRRDEQFERLLTKVTESQQIQVQGVRDIEHRRAEAIEEQIKQADIRWKKEREGRERREALKSIPPPQPMTFNQDLADYIEMFEANMASREIDPGAWTHHLIPLLNGKASTAISGLPPEARADYETLRDTILATAHTTTKYASKAFWTHTKPAGESLRVTATKIARLARRFAVGKSEEEIREKFCTEKIIQLLPPETQAYVREKEPSTPYAAADLATKHFILKEIDEVKFDSEKPWTFKSKSELGPHERHHKAFKPWYQRNNRGFDKRSENYNSHTYTQMT